MSEPLNPTERERRVDEIIQTYLDAVAQDERPDVEALLTSHADLADELRNFFENDQAMRQRMHSLHRSAAFKTTSALAVSGDTLAAEMPRGDFGDYTLLEKLGEGGMGRVYRARHVKLKRIVALKLIVTGREATPAELSRFRIEAEAVARLQHPGIVQIFEVGEQDGQPFLALEYCEGRTLQERLRHESVTAEQAAEIVQQLADAVQAAHQRHVIHRDLKPSNVLLTPDQRVKITDFGLAKKLDEDEGLTQSNAIVGTPSYLAPEQAAQKNAEVGPAVDIYALGAILYELLTGRPPFKAPDPMSTLLKVIGDEPVSPRRRNAKVPRDLETICLKCLEKDPHRRYASAADLSEDLQRFLHGKPIHARSVRQTERFWRWCKRYPAIATLAAAVVMLLLAGTAISTAFAIKASRNEGKALRLADEKGALAAEKVSLANKEMAARKVAESRAREIERKNKETQWHLYVARLFPMRDAWEKRDFGQLERLLAESVPKAGEADFRGWEWYYFQDQCQHASRRLGGKTRYTGAAAWCRSTGKIALATRGTIEVWDAAGKTIEQTLLCHKLPVIRKLAWSPDGTRLAFCRAHSNILTIWDLSANKAWRKLPAHEGGIRDVAWSPDGNRLASSGTIDGLIKVWDLKEGRVLVEMDGRISSSLAQIAYSLSWHPDGVRLAAGHRGGFCRVWDTETGKLLWWRRKFLSNGPLLAVAWSPDGTKLAVGHSPDIVVWDERGSEVALLRGHTSTINSLQWSQDGNRLLSGGDDHTVKIWNPDRGSTVRTLRIHKIGVRAVAWSPDDRHVLSVSNEARLSPAEQGLRKVTECKCSSSRVFNVAWSPHGRELFFAAGDGGGIWDPGTGELKRMWSSIRREPVQSISFKPDGSQVCLTKYWAESLIRSTRTGKSLQTFFPPNARTQGTNDCAWSPDGKWLAIPFDYGIWIWRTSPWQHVATIDRRPEEYGSRYWCVAWSPDSRLIAGGTGVGLTVWHVGEQRKLYQTHAGFIRTALEWSADGRLLLAGTSSGELVFFRAADGKVIRRSRGHKSPITGAQWSANGRRVASVSHDGTVKIWDAATGVNLVTLRVEGTLVNGLAWNSDGQLACACEDGALRIWGSPGMRQASQKATHLETGVLASSSSTKHL